MGGLKWIVGDRSNIQDDRFAPPAVQTIADAVDGDRTMTPLDTLTALRKTYPTPMSPAQLGELLNETAWQHRAEGYGLLKKPAGGNCPQPVTGTKVSRDILMLPDGRIYDCLIDAEGQAIPTWGPKKPVSPALWLAPVDADAAVPPDPPTPEPPPAGVPYPGDQVGVQIGEVLFADYAAAGQDPNPGMGTWFLRVAWDCCNPPYLSADESIAKHRAEWLAILNGSA